MMFVPENGYLFETNDHGIYIFHRETDKLTEPYVDNEEDTYLSLDVLAVILEKLSAQSGKIKLSRQIIYNYYTDYHRIFLSICKVV